MQGAAAQRRGARAPLLHPQQRGGHHGSAETARAVAGGPKVRTSSEVNPLPMYEYQDRRPEVVKGRGHSRAVATTFAYFLQLVNIQKMIGTCTVTRKSCAMQLLDFSVYFVSSGDPYLGQSVLTRSVKWRM